MQIIKKIKYFSVLLLSFLPVLVFAQGSPGSGQGSPGSGQGSPGGAAGKSVQLDNPLNNETLMGLLQDILDVIMIFAVPIIVFFIIYAGFLYVTARGNETQVSNATRALLYAVVGGVIILGAQVLLEVISGTIAAF